jgi:hypothetical protein
MSRDYTSKVPRKNYSSNREEQKKELESDAMLARFAQSRKEMSTDPHRPLYHFVSPESTLNDPNGPLLLAGSVASFLSGISSGRPPATLGSCR